MSARAGLVALLAAGCSTPEVLSPTEVPVDPADWPSYGRDRDNSRTNPAETKITAATVGSLSRAWEFNGPGVTSTPAVRDGVVYFGAWDGAVHAVSAADGAPVWATVVSERAVDASALVTEALVYIGDGLANVHALDRKTGATAWTVKLDAHPDAHIFGSPVAIDDLIVVGVASIELARVKDDYTFRGSVVGMDAATGEERWRVYTTENDASAGAGVSVWSSAAVDIERKLLFIGTGNTYEPPAAPRSDAMLAIHYETGEIAWLRQFTAGDVYTIFAAPPNGPDADLGAAPNLFQAGGRDVVGVGDKAGVYSVLDRETGETVWARQLTQGSHLGGVMASTAHADGVIYINSNKWVEVADFMNPENTSTTFALRAEDGEVLWESDMPWPCFGGMAVANEVLLHGTTDGTLRALDRRDGREVWSDRLGDSAGGSPSISNGLVLMGHGFELFYVGGVVEGGLVAYGPP